jgi:EAL domain-containing protein (putative c-di-GMP-specific phosphodiesterase class I)
LEEPHGQREKRGRRPVHGARVRPNVGYHDESNVSLFQCPDAISRRGLGWRGTGRVAGAQRSRAACSSENMTSPVSAQICLALFAPGELPMNFDLTEPAPSIQTSDYESCLDPTSPELRTAVKNGELFLLYQPKLDLTTGCVSGAEALARWNHPRYGVLEPKSFISLAERTGIICELGAWALDQACWQVNDWQERGGFSGSVAVNVSALELRQPEFVDVVRDALERHNTDPGRLVLEITESFAMEDPAHIIPALSRLIDMGIGVSLDDFGTGHASLVHLKHLPISELKIDRGFIGGIEHCKKDAAIVRAIIALANAFDVNVVAEGVETVGQLTVLGNMGCRLIQGYLVGRAMRPGELVRTASDYGSFRLP